jgi:hypothetical protein
MPIAPINVQEACIYQVLGAWNCAHRKNEEAHSKQAADGEVHSKDEAQQRAPLHVQAYELEVIRHRPPNANDSPSRRLRHFGCERA